MQNEPNLVRLLPAVCLAGRRIQNPLFDKGLRQKCEVLRPKNKPKRTQFIAAEQWRSRNEPNFKRHEDSLTPVCSKTNSAPYSPPFSARRPPVQGQGYRSISYEGPRWIPATSIGGAKFCGIAQIIIRIELLGVRGYTTTLIGSPGPVRKRGPDLAMVRYSGTPGFQIGKQDPAPARVFVLSDARRYG